MKLIDAYNQNKRITPKEKFYSCNNCGEECSHQQMVDGSFFSYNYAKGEFENKVYSRFICPHCYKGWTDISGYTFLEVRNTK